MAQPQTKRDENGEKGKGFQQVEIRPERARHAKLVTEGNNPGRGKKKSNEVEKNARARTGRGE